VETRKVFKYNSRRNKKKRGCMKAPHMSKKMEGVAVVETSVLLAAHNLKYQHPEAKHIRFY
jgi:hypothetical protein